MLCASALTPLLPCWQGYTGFLPGHGNHFAKTYGNVSKAALAERQANDDPLKWRKFVSYAEFTPPKTPAEGHFIPGYSGNVAGVYGENLFAKTYGKTTLQAVSGDYPKGQIYNTEEQVRLTRHPHCGRPRRQGPGRAVPPCNRRKAAGVRCKRHRWGPSPMPVRC